MSEKTPNPDPQDPKKKKEYTDLNELREEIRGKLDQLDRKVRSKIQSASILPVEK